MSIPDIDYELGEHMSQFEYSVEIAGMKPDQVDAVAQAFRNGEKKQQQRILKELEELANGYDHLHIPLFKLRKIIDDN
jgi:hypothetical protein